MLIDASGDDLCSTATMVSYGLLECVTKPKAYDTATAVSVKAAKYECANPDTTACEYATVSATPSFSSVTLNGDGVNLVVAGSNLDGYGATCEFEILGMAATSCTIDSASQITVGYTNGVPISDAVIEPVLRLLDDCNSALSTLCTTATVQNKLVAGKDVAYAGPTNAISVTSGAERNAISSFAGGRRLLIDAKGLTTSMQNNRASIKVCGKECAFDLTNSDASTAACDVPFIDTLTSIAQFTNAEVGRLQGTTLESASGMGTLAFDGKNLPSLSSTEANCYIGMEFESDSTTSFVGKLEELRFYMDHFVEKALYKNNLKFQGSSDGFVSDINDILTVGEELHEGWMYYKLSNTDLDIDIREPKYQSYRLFNTQSYGCDKLGEIHIIGQKIIDGSGSTQDCAVVVSGTDFTTTTAGSTVVTYSISETPFITSLSPRWGTVEGGTSVTFTGQGFTTTAGDYSILIDDVPCTGISATSTTVTCTTGPRTGRWVDDPQLSIVITGKGSVAIQGNTFRYVSLWSSESTWGGQFPPIAGESVAITKGINLLFDLDASPVLKLIVIDGGSLIFPSHSDPAHQRTFDAHYIFLNNGALLEIGTEADVYTSKMTLTMHGQRNDPYIPKFGNKCIGVRFSTLDIHGVPRTPTWTSLQTTASVGDTSITVMEDTDW